MADNANNPFGNFFGGLNNANQDPSGSNEPDNSSSGFMADIFGEPLPTHADPYHPDHYLGTYNMPIEISSDSSAYPAGANMEVDSQQHTDSTEWVPVPSPLPPVHSPWLPPSIPHTPLYHPHLTPEYPPPPLGSPYQQPYQSPHETYPPPQHQSPQQSYHSPLPPYHSPLPEFNSPHYRQPQQAQAADQGSSRVPSRKPRMRVPDLIERVQHDGERVHIRWSTPVSDDMETNSEEPEEEMADEPETTSRQSLHEAFGPFDPNQPTNQYGSFIPSNFAGSSQLIVDTSNSQANPSSPPPRTNNELTRKVRDDRFMVQYARENEPTPPPMSPNNPFEACIMGYRDPPPQYDYPTLMPQSYDEFMIRTLRHEDELQREVQEWTKKKKKKNGMLKKFVKKFQKD